MPRLALLLWPAAVVVGLAAEWVGFGWADPRHWAPDLITGWSLIAGGLIAWRCRPDSRVGVLVVVIGLSWFVGNFAVTGVAGVDWLARQGVFVHRGPLVHLLLAYPGGRLTTTRGRVMVGIYYLAAVMSWWRSDVATIVLAVLLVGYVADEYRRAVGRFRRARLLAVQAAAALGVVLVLGAVARLALLSGDASYPALIAYQVVLAAGVSALVAGLLSHRWEQVAMTDLVVELGQSREANLRDSLARALGDPSLQVGYWVPDSRTFVDSAGRPLALPPAGSRRSTYLDRDGQPVAVVLHDAAVLDDPNLLDAVSSAARLAAANARLQAAVRAQVSELRASSRRIVEAADEEGRRLERRLHEGPERRLRDLADALATARRTNGNDPLIDPVENRLAGTLDELRRLAHGLHPRVLSEHGLAEALTALAQRCPLPVTVTIADIPVPTPLESVVYFVCAEALTNITKYAHATTATVTVSATPTWLIVTVADNGSGGADPARGSGLRGLADRVETLGGRFQVTSPPERGTRLAAEIPINTGIR
jgi:signal transduction histidine kinase